MLGNPVNLEQQCPLAFRFYHEALAVLQASGTPFLVGGAYALVYYTGIARHTKDLDVFIRPDDCPRFLKTFADAGYYTELTFSHWLAKAYRDDDFIDAIFSSGNALATVDDGWFAHAVESEVFGEPVLLCPAEEMIWSKAFVMERERYDGADVSHLLRARAAKLDWPRLLERFGRHWRVLLSHLVMFGHIYPSDRGAIPDKVMRDLLGGLQEEITSPAPARQVCQGTLLSRSQYLTDIEKWGYQDVRLVLGNMTRKQIAQWTAGIAVDGKR